MKFNLTLFICLFVSFSVRSQDPFKDFTTIDFTFQGHQAKVVLPQKKDSLAKWIWRARFWAHEPQTDLALLSNGFHLVYIDVANLFGNQEAINLWNDFYIYCRETYHLNPKVALEGMSRGGLIVYNWAAQNTDKVACIYADAPVCDLKSWPGGKYKGIGSPDDWQKALAAHQLDEESILEYKNMPIYTAKAVAIAKIPILHICGEDDMVVPYEENTAILEKTVIDEGGQIQIILKKGIGHHPHSLQDPSPIVEFIRNNY